MRTATRLIKTATKYHGGTPIIAIVEHHHGDLTICAFTKYVKLSA